MLTLYVRFTPPSGQDLTGPLPYDPDSPIQVAVRASFESSLRNLHCGDQWRWSESEADKARRRPWIDSYLLHSPFNTLEETLQAWHVMEELVLEGKVRQIGFSSE
jgi:aryl-alcohol dehydrogenase-like predicted oxidoreductase